MKLGDLFNSGEPSYTSFFMFLGIFLSLAITTFVIVNYLISKYLNKNDEA
jgi:hypothetical protein